MRTLFGRLWAEGIQKTFVFARSEQAALDTQLAHQVGKTKPIHQHANAADNTGLVHENFVCRRSQIIGSRSARFFYHSVNGFAMKLAQPTYFVINQAGLHRRPPRRIDHQHQSSGALIIKSAAHGRDDVFGTGVRAIGNFSLDRDHRRMRHGRADRLCVVAHQVPDQHACKYQPHQAQKNFPATCSALLAQHGAEQSVQGLPLPRSFRVCRCFGARAVLLLHEGLRIQRA